jgi:hypothetical protein
MWSVNTLPNVRLSSDGGDFGERDRVMVISDMVFSAGFLGFNPLGD